MSQSKEEVSFPERGIGTRVLEISDRVGGKKALARSLGISESQLYRYINDEQEMKITTALRMSRVGAVSLMWLLTGEGGSGSHGRSLPEPPPFQGLSTRLKAVIARFGGSEAIARQVGMDASDLLALCEQDQDIWLSLAATIASATGVNLQWLVYGTGTAQPSEEADKALTPRDAEDILTRSEREIEDSYEGIREKPLDFNDLKVSIEQVATSETLPDEIRAKADMMLRLAFQDLSAEARDKRRRSRLTALWHKRLHILERAIDITGVELPPVIYEQLKDVVVMQEPDVDTLVALLSAMQAQLS